MTSDYVPRYDIDIALCIDATAGMGSLLDTLKENALNFHNDFMSAIGITEKHINKLRVRIIAFRDYLADGEDAMSETKFFSLPDEAEAFSNALNRIKPFGGGDHLEDGLEALALAMKSEWSTTGSERKRHIIVVLSDDGTHDIGFGRAAYNYPSQMPSSFEELTAMWGDSGQPGIMDNVAKRLLIFAPNIEYWRTISEVWSNTIIFPSGNWDDLKILRY